MGNDKERSAYEKVKISRKSNRPGIMDYINGLFSHFIEMHGDRLYKDDPAIVGGIALFHDVPVTVIGTKKAHEPEENLKCNFGMASPEGYRKARRLMEQAEKFHRPVITFIDTPGAYPGIEAESNGQSNAIAESLAFMSRMQVPSIAIITGEGNSGGALGLALSDRVYMLENAVYSILSPEGFASILWKDSKQADRAAELMKLTAQELLSFGLIDSIIKEDSAFLRNLDMLLERDLRDLIRMKKSALLESRRQKYRKVV